MPSGARLGFNVLHEVAGHVFHFNHLRRNKFNIDPALLCLCLHTQESFYVEGVAQLLTILAAENLEDSDLTRSIRREVYLHGLTMGLALFVYCWLISLTWPAMTSTTSGIVTMRSTSTPRARSSLQR